MNKKKRKKIIKKNLKKLPNQKYLQKMKLILKKKRKMHTPNLINGNNESSRAYQEFRDIVK